MSELYKVRLDTLSLLEKQAQEDLFDLYYGDETGVSEQGYCPYGWQFKDEKVSIKVTHGQQINCFGLLSRNNQLHFKTTFLITQAINTDFLIRFFDEFVINLKKTTVIVLDNAKIHQSKAFKKRCAYWQMRGLFFVFLPPYSPHLNIIEKLWHELKQRWIRPEDYLSFEALCFAVHLALSAVGHELFIKFNEFNHSSK